MRERIFHSKIGIAKRMRELRRGFKIRIELLLFGRLKCIN